MPELKQNEGQITAIHHGTGPMLVLAGPGSGKTYVITHRIRHLISECKIPPNNILVLTFTKAAALEMQARAHSLSPQCVYVQFGTFHSIFYQILRLSNPYERLTLATDKERMDFVCAVLQTSSRQDLKEKEVAEKAENCLKEISQRKNTAGSGHQMSSEEFEKVFQEYEAWLKENQKLDFDDMVAKCFAYLLKNKSEREKWQKCFSYILIDEFQDINPLQYETIKLISGNGNLFVVGDDDQAIYGFRGSDPKLMKRFEEELEAPVVRLSYNYRCCPQITRLVTEFIAHNKNRFSKEIVATKKQVGEVQIIKTKNRMEEADYLQKETQRYAMANPGKSQAILTRTNGLFKLYESAIGRHTENPLWQDIKAYLKFINHGKHRKDFLHIMNKPSRYISRNILTEEVVDFDVLRKRLRDKPWIGERIMKLQKQVDFARKLDLRGQLRYIWNAMGYEQYIKEISEGDECRAKEASRHFTKLLETVKNGCNYETLVELMERDTDQASDKDEWQKNIHIMTYHGSKGLEFDRVYLPDLNYGKVPHGRMLTEEELEEERRMFYVAMTRAKESLVLLYDQKQTGSPFLSEISFGECYSDSSSESSISSSNSQLSRYSSKASSTFSNSVSSPI